jgi:hypothetical protein
MAMVSDDNASGMEFSILHDTEYTKDAEPHSDRIRELLNPKTVRYYIQPEDQSRIIVATDSKSYKTKVESMWGADVKWGRVIRDSMNGSKRIA